MSIPTEDAGIYNPARSNAEYGSPQWEKDNQAEVNSRPRALPLDQRAWPYGRPDKYPRQFPPLKNYENS